MNCSIINDLLPLYVDGCCSRESEALIKEHLGGCKACRETYELMKRDTPESTTVPDIKLKAISNFRAALLQSLMLFVSFALMTLGVVLEGRTPTGDTNGLWATALIVPSAGYLLSVGNWFFVRTYRSRKSFSLSCALSTLIITALGYVWAFLHYSSGITLSSPLVILGAALSLVFILLSKLLSDKYASLLGRE